MHMRGMLTEEEIAILGTVAVSMSHMRVVPQQRHEP